MPCFGKKKKQDEDDDDSVQDESAAKLSHVGRAAYEVLRTKHAKYHKELWNVTGGVMRGDLQFTPKDAFTRTADAPPRSGHNEWFPENMSDLIAKTEDWCDILTLNPPDGLFVEGIKEALAEICKREIVINRVIVRFMFGNIIGLPCNCNRLMEEFTSDLPPDAHKKLRIWVGAWRKGASWNHAKIVAVDGKHLWTGGHNYWDYHYLRDDPVVDVSIQLVGPCSVDGHYYANRQWAYIQKKQSTCRGQFIDKCIPDSIELPLRERVSVTEWPPNDSSEFPPTYVKRKTANCKKSERHQQMMQSSLSDVHFSPDNYVPIITLGRQGVLYREDRPSDDAFIAMIQSAKKTIRMSLQDLGPIQLPGTNNCLPGLKWPKMYLRALARAIWENGVDVEIVLSNPGSIPGRLSFLEACYGNGWTCVDVASEIIKRVKKTYPEGTDADLRQKVQENLRVCYIRCPVGGRKYKDSGTYVGLHSKHFIVDDVCCYIGSQNMYMSDLAEWGVAIDDPKTVKKIKGDFWDPMWKVSYTGEDCDVESVMSGMKINRGAANRATMTPEQHKAATEALEANNHHGIAKNDAYHIVNQREVKRFSMMPVTGRPQPQKLLRVRRVTVNESSKMFDMKGRDFSDSEDDVEEVVDHRRRKIVGKRFSV